MICRDCGHCGPKDGLSGPRIIGRDDNGNALSWCHLHNKEVRYWIDSCSDNDGDFYDPEYDNEPEPDFDDEEY